MHGFEPTPADARSLAKADLVIVNGLEFEGWLDRLIKASGQGPGWVATTSPRSRPERVMTTTIMVTITPKKVMTMITGTAQE